MSKTEQESQEQQKYLSIVAERRVTWEKAMKMCEEQASQFYLRHKDELADAFRSLAKEMRDKAFAASDEQGRLLKELGLK